MIYLKLYEKFINGSTASSPEDTPENTPEIIPDISTDVSPEGATASEPEIIPEIHSEDQAIELLLNLTRTTIPSGKEDIIYDMVQANCKEVLKEDSFGNLYCAIGNSKLLFTAHLDSACKKESKVYQIIEDDFLKTNKKTILGGDNKVGCAVLLNMINHDIPGVYFFFVKEEVGRLGSEHLNSLIKDDMFNFCLAFDRKGIDSVITHQRGVKLCTDELAEFIIKEFSKNGYSFHKDPTGLSCDTYSFNNKINNCLNISSGVYDEHSKSEKIDLNYYKYLYNIVTTINWKEIEKLSEKKERGGLSTDDLKIENPIIKTILDYFIKFGYFPNKAPDFEEDFSVYRTRNIHDRFHMTINKNGSISIFDLRLTKERVIEFIRGYKRMFFKFKIKNNSYQVIGIDTAAEGNSKIITLIKNNKRRVVIEVTDKLLFAGKTPDLQQIANTIYAHIKKHNIWWFGRLPVRKSPPQN